MMPTLMDAARLREAMVGTYTESPKLVHAAGGHIERNSVRSAAFQSHGTTVQRHGREAPRPNDASCRSARVNHRAAECTA